LHIPHHIWLFLFDYSQFFYFSLFFDNLNKQVNLIRYAKSITGFCGTINLGCSHPSFPDSIKVLPKHTLIRISNKLLEGIIGNEEDKETIVGSHFSVGAVNHRRRLQQFRPTRWRPCSIQ
jgi:hypothetical protein